MDLVLQTLIKNSFGWDHVRFPISASHRQSCIVQDWFIWTHVLINYNPSMRRVGKLCDGSLKKLLPLVRLYRQEKAVWARDQYQGMWDQTFFCGGYCSHRLSNSHLIGLQQRPNVDSCIILCNFVLYPSTLATFIIRKQQKFNIYDNQSWAKCQCIVDMIKACNDECIEKKISSHVILNSQYIIIACNIEQYLQLQQIKLVISIAQF